jgi:potassium efflux system protein
LLCSYLLVALAGPVNAQVEEASVPRGDSATAPATSTAPKGDTPPAPTTTTEVVKRLDAVSNRLLAINDYLRKPAPDLAGITIALPDRSREADDIIGGAGAIDPLQADLVELAATVEKLRNLDRIFGKWRKRLQEEVAVLDPWRGQLRADAEFLRDAASPSAQDSDNSDAVPEVLRSRLRQVAADIETTRAPLRRRVDAVVAADLRVSGLQTALRDLEVQLDDARISRQAQTLALTAPPVWRPPASLRLPLELVTQRIGTITGGLADYFYNRQPELAAFGLGLVVLLVAVSRLRRSVLARGETEADQLLTRHPFAVTLLVWMLIGPFILLPQLPIGAGLIRALAAAILLWRILPALVTAIELPPLNGLLLIAVVFLLQSVVLGDDWYGRLSTVLLGVLTFLAFRALARASDTVSGARSMFQRGIRAVARVAPWIVAVGLVAEVVGARALGQQAIGGIVFLSLLLCSLLAVDAILCSIVDGWVSGPGARWFRGVRRWPDAVRTRSRWITRLLLVIAFLNFLPKILPIVEPVWVGIQHLLTTSVNVGDAELSLGNVLWFLVGVTGALALARLVRFILDEDVLPRLPLAMGAASAASRLTYYGLVVLGILFALAASGVALSNLTLVVSALGVGIGFGLQNIVNNFVSGLILAFERPVREGDQITLGTTVGRVSEIGLRATRIRTFEGAEVIVPNANLIANELTNWTLSDRTRRIDIAVGVDYGSDPVQVQALLREAIKDQPSVAAFPEPVTVFRGFGASSLDFSLLFWTTDVDQRFAVETEARTRVLAALRSAGVTIPFPQLDLWVRDGVKLTSSGPPATGS